MPRGVGKLSCLWKLPFFVVGEKTCSKEGVQLAHHVEEIKALENLKGNLHIEIYIPTNANYVMESGRKGGCLSQHLTEIVIAFPERNEDFITRVDEIDEALLEDLQPHPNLRGLELEDYRGGRMVEYEQGLLLEGLKPHPKLRILELYNYGGRRMPNWASQDNLAISLPNIVELTLWNCTRLQQLLSLRKLCNLKSLHLYCLHELEYMENTTSSANISDGAGTWESEIFFPSLEKLELYEMPKLKGWWSNDEITDSSNQRGCRQFPSFPRLSKLRIEECPNLTRFPPCPTMEDLKCDEVLRIEINTESANSELWGVNTSNIGFLRSILPIEGFQCAKSMQILNYGAESLSEVEELFRSCSSTLRELTISNGENGEIWNNELKSISGGLEHLTALVSLELSHLYNLSLSKGGEGEEEGEEDIDEEMPWRCLGHSLCSLKLDYLPKMVKLPDGMRYLTALESLELSDLDNLSPGKEEEGEGEGEDEDEDGLPWHCLGHSLRSLKLKYLPKMVKLPNGIRYLTALQSLIIKCCALESVPEWMPELTYLKKLRIMECSDGLPERCSRPTGEGHIPKMQIFNDL